MDLLGLILLTFFYTCQVLIYYFIFLPIINGNNSNNKEKPGLSVIICAKNEARNIERNLKRICSQNYPTFEVILMDDHSEDDTSEVVRKLSAEYANLRYFKASQDIKYSKGKKKALEEAKAKAKYHHLILTDADCWPGSGNWLKYMAEKFSGEIEIVLGIGQYENRKGILNGLIQYETMFTAMSYLGMSMGGSPYMGVGRNLAYKRTSSKFKDEKGVELHSGDDDLFLQGIMKSNNVAICIEKEGQMTSSPAEGFKHWIRQKSRHYSTAFFYSKKSIIHLLAIKSSFYLPNLIVLILLFGDLALPIFFLFTLRSVVYWSYWNKMRRELHFPRKIYFLPCYEIFFSLFDIWITTKNLIKVPSQWK